MQEPDHGDRVASEESLGLLRLREPEPRGELLYPEAAEGAQGGEPREVQATGETHEVLPAEPGLLQTHSSQVQVFLL